MKRRWPRSSVGYVGKAKHIADLFCGVGPFALRLAAKARIAAFDSDAGAVSALQKAASATSGLKPVKAEARDLFRRPLMPPELRDYDAVVFDPPRQGAQAQATQLGGQQGAGRDRRLLQCGDLCARRAHPGRRRLPSRRRHAGRPVQAHAACRAGGAIFAVIAARSAAMPPDPHPATHRPCPRRSARRRRHRARRIARAGDRDGHLRLRYRPVLFRRAAARHHQAAAGRAHIRRCTRCSAGDADRRLGSMDRRRRMVERRRAARSTCSIATSRTSRTSIEKCRAGEIDDALSAGPSARILHRDLDGRGRTVPAVARSRGPACNSSRPPPRPTRARCATR